MDQEEKLKQKAIEYIKINRKNLIDKFTCPLIFPSDSLPVSVFMAGSPGAGKTEFSKNLIRKFEQRDGKKVIRIDPDEIRKTLPGYNGKNSHIFQAACSIGVDKLHDIALKNKQNFVLDGTFSNYDRSHSNIERSLNKGRKVSIIYLYQDPLIAWEFTKKRERLEGRHIPQKAFVEELFAAKENVNKVKKIFGQKIYVELHEHNFETGMKKMRLNIESIDSYLSIKYTKNELEKELS